MIPERVIILGAAFSVSVCDLPDNLAGDSDDAGRVIRINKRLGYDVQLETLYHEVIHMMFALGGYQHVLSDKREEALAQFLGVAFSNFLLSNGALK